MESLVNIGIILSYVMIAFAALATIGFGVQKMMQNTNNAKKTMYTVGGLVVAFIIAIFIVLMFFLFDKLLIFVPTFLAGFIQYISVDYHFSNISRGVIDSRNIIYFLSVIGIFLFATIQNLNRRRWE